MRSTRYSFNPWQNRPAAISMTQLTDPDSLAFHRTLEGYSKTPLLHVPALAGRLGLRNILVKDESKRFGLNAFKGLGASYAVYRFLKQEWAERVGTQFDYTVFQSTDLMKKLGEFTFTTATDGNHGRAVAWTARKLKQRAVIYMPGNTVPARVKVLEKEGATVIVVDGNYDAAVAQCTCDARKNGWQIVSDMGWPGYEQIPRWISTGYGTLFQEIAEDLAAAEQIDAVILQAGVGGMACAGTDYFSRGRLRIPKLICAEPLDADCFLESILSGNGERVVTKGNQQSLMAGLNCGTASSVAWPYIKYAADLFMAFDDGWALRAMRTFHSPRDGDPAILSGESGAAGLAGLLALMTDDLLAQTREKLGLGSDSTVLLINTEGDTDPVNFNNVVNDVAIQTY